MRYDLSKKVSCEVSLLLIRQIILIIIRQIHVFENEQYAAAFCWIVIRHSIRFYSPDLC